jgi:hypothetical protein
VCEEAHRYVPLNAALGFEPCKRAIAKIAKEGRKYGASLCIVTQRPAEIDPTILSQCNTVFALRMSNDRDQAIVTSAIADTGSGLLEFLPALGQREAIAFGDGVALPVRIKFDELPKNCLPRSSTARFSEKWLKSTGDEGFLDSVVERWRSAGLNNGDEGQAMSMMADALDIPGVQAASEPAHTPQLPVQGMHAAMPHHDAGAMAQRPSGMLLRKDQQTGATGLGGTPGTPQRPMMAQLRRDTSAPTATPAPATDPAARLSLRERLMRPQAR